MPHILPCPAPRTDYADAGTAGDGQRKRRRKRPAAESTVDGTTDRGSAELEEESALLARKTRECPVPKPSGLIGEVLGFKKGDIERPILAPIVRIETAGPNPKTPKDE